MDLEVFQAELMHFQNVDDLAEIHCKHENYCEATQIQECFATEGHDCSMLTTIIGLLENLEHVEVTGGGLVTSDVPNRFGSLRRTAATARVGFRGHEAPDHIAPDLDWNDVHQLDFVPAHLMQSLEQDQSDPAAARFVDGLEVSLANLTTLSLMLKCKPGPRDFNDFSDEWLPDLLKLAPRLRHLSPMFDSTVNGEADN
ncbi:hypothetical protein MMYC01_207800 [Madurella mycetomatis]|uniref:Uncharacterized protein n=1 Tax=Madurella mycetomatis TaxID=100816 RepID=A0A175VXK5_9PEZI|nr:hypothetical protein MMYC01_207800 [Madurella mycetomatis]